MKILLLNQNVDAQRKVFLCLKNAGASVLSPMNVEEAWETLQLHGSSVDLAIIHREGGPGQEASGLDLVAKIKKDPSQADLPMIVTHEKWSDQKAAEHQAGPTGANAYLASPFTDEQLKAVIEGVLGLPVGGASSLGNTEFEVPLQTSPSTQIQLGPSSKAQPGAISQKKAPSSQPTHSTKPKAPVKPEPGINTGGVPKPTASLLLADEALQDPSVMFSLAQSDGTEIDSSSINLAPPDSPSSPIEGISLEPPSQAEPGSLSIPDMPAPPRETGSIRLEGMSSPPAAPENSGKAESTLQIQLAADSGGELERREGPSIQDHDSPTTIPTDESDAFPTRAENGPEDLFVSGTNTSVGGGLSEPSVQAPSQTSFQSQISGLSMVGVPTDSKISGGTEASIMLPDANQQQSASSEGKPDEAQAEPLSQPLSEPVVSGTESLLAGLVQPAPVAEPAMNAAPMATLPVAAPPEEDSDDPEAHKEMPYLFGKKSPPSPEDPAALAAFAQPVGDAVVPGGAAQTPDMETLKKYLLLREQDVAALSSQLKTSREQISAVEELLKVEKARSAELDHMLEQCKRKLEGFDQEKTQAIDALQSEINELRFQMRAKGDKASSLEAQVRTAAEEIEQIKKRVRVDIRKIRMREKELENKLEIMKKDSEALIGARESKIIELKRKLDLLEFNMDLLQDQYSREKEMNHDLKVRLAKASQAMKVAGGLLDVDQQKVETKEGEGADPVAQPLRERKAV